MVISPYWDDIDLRGSGGVYYNCFTPENGTDVLKLVQTFLMRNQSIDFTAKSVIVIKWMNVCPFGDSLCNYVSRVNILVIIIKYTAQNPTFCMIVLS